MFELVCVCVRGVATEQDDHKYIDEILTINSMMATIPICIDLRLIAIAIDRSIDSILLHIHFFTKISWTNQVKKY